MGIAYEKDIVAWANEQANFIRSGRFELLDLEHIAEEIEDVGKSEQRELSSRMVVLLAHLLKWQFQPARRGVSWKATISAQRQDIAFALKETPSLKTRLANDEWIAVAWAKAVALAIDETGLESFPEVLPWSVTDVLKGGWMPE
jgi:hypothetical protein